MIASDWANVITAIASAVAVVVSLYAVKIAQKVLVYERKQHLKSELQAVREALGEVLRVHGVFEAKIMAFWPLQQPDHAEIRRALKDEVRNPLGDPAALATADAREAATAIRSTGLVLATAVQGVRAIAPNAWDASEVDRLTAWIEAFTREAWWLQFRTIVMFDPEDPVAGIELMKYLVREDSDDLVAFATAHLLTDGEGGLELANAAQTSGHLVDSALDRIVSEVRAFMTRGDVVSSGKQTLESFPPATFLTGAFDVVLPDGPEPPGELGDRIVEMFPDYGLHRSNPWLALACRQALFADIARAANRESAEGLDDYPDLQRILRADPELIPLGSDGHALKVWPATDVELFVVDSHYADGILDRPRGNIRFLDPSTEASFLAEFDALG